MTPLRCQQKCDKGSQCTREVDHGDGYHLTEHGCVCLTEDPREFVVTFQGVELVPASGEMIVEPCESAGPPARPGTVAEVPESSPEHSDALKRLKAFRELSADELRATVERAAASWGRKA